MLIPIMGTGLSECASSMKPPISIGVGKPVIGLLYVPPEIQNEKR